MFLSIIFVEVSSMKKVISIISLLGLSFLISCTDIDNIEKTEIILELKGDERINSFQHLVHEGYIYGTGATDSSIGDFDGAIGEPYKTFLFKLDINTNSYEIKQLPFENRGFPATVIALNPAGNLVVAGYLSGVSINMHTIVISEFDTDLNLLSQNYVDHATATYVSSLVISPSGYIGLITLNANILVLDDDYNVIYSRANPTERAYYEKIMVEGENFMVVGCEKIPNGFLSPLINSVVIYINPETGLQWIANFDIENDDYIMNIFHSETDVYKALGIHRINDDEIDIFISVISDEGEISNMEFLKIPDLTHVHEIGRIGDNYFVLLDKTKKKEVTHFLVLLNQNLRIINQYEVVGDNLEYQEIYVDNGSVYLSYNNDKSSNDLATLLIEKIKYKD